MQNEIPESKWKRTVVGGKTAMNVGGKALKYLVKKPFLSDDQQALAKESFEKDYAETIFKGLVILKGTALKIAQLLSFELDIVPPAIRRELEKSYNQVPPLNRALVRKVILNAFGEEPENLFSSFDTKAFAAASLGQVHRAVTREGEELAIKVQYPGINKTIRNDVQLVKSIVKPLPDAKIVLPVLDEIEKRLLEEIDYLQEADHVAFFTKNLVIEGVVVPAVNADFCTETVISTQYLEGESLDVWIRTNPDQAARDKVAGILNDIFLISLFELNCIHADPNPGNFIIHDHHKVGLVDFGCVKRFTPEFVENYGQITRVAISGNQQEYFRFLQKMDVLDPNIDQSTETGIFEIMVRVAQWYGKLYENEIFDFGANADFIAEGKKLMQGFYKYRKLFHSNPEFVFLNRTRYGLFRIFERLGAKVKIRNPYEFG
ncbi:MAG: AarF/ABC1/UbiB kinase family protein [Proteobacteria bacterium]|nr:AarF/ABC1/UbiB kinase family protein [Pseudomonadota bacterium]